MKLKVNFAASTPATPGSREHSDSVSIWRTMRVRQPQAPSEVPFLSVFLKREPVEGLRYSRMRLARLGLLRPLIPQLGRTSLRVRPCKVDLDGPFGLRRIIIREVSSEFAAIAVSLA